MRFLLALLALLLTAPGAARDVYPGTVPTVFSPGLYRFIGEFGRLAMSGARGATIEGGSFSALTLSNCNSVTLCRVSVHDSLTDGITLRAGCRNIALVGCVSERSYHRGLQIDAGCATVTVTGGEYSWARRGDGIAADGCSGLLVDSVMASHNAGDSGDGIQLSGGCTGVRIVRCLTSYCGNAGVIEQKSAVTVSACASWGNRHGFAASGGSLGIQNSLAWGCEWGVFCYREFAPPAVSMTGSVCKGSIKDFEKDGAWK